MLAQLSSFFFNGLLKVVVEMVRLFYFHLKFEPGTSYFHNSKSGLGYT